MAACYSLIVITGQVPELNIFRGKFSSMTGRKKKKHPPERDVATPLTQRDSLGSSGIAFALPSASREG